MATPAAQFSRVGLATAVTPPSREEQLVNEVKLQPVGLVVGSADGGRTQTGFPFS